MPGVILRHTADETRDDGTRSRRFVIERDVVFATEPDGFAATVTLVRADAQAGATESRMFAAANARLLGLPIVFHLDTHGNVRSVEDVSGAWVAWTAGLSAAARLSGNPNGSGAKAVRAPLAQLPDDRKLAIIASMITGLIAKRDDYVVADARTVSVTASPLFGGPPLTGEASSVRAGDEVRHHIAARGATPAGATTEMMIDRTIDPATGLIRSVRQTEVTKTADAGTLKVTSTQSLRIR